MLRPVFERVPLFNLPVMALVNTSDSTLCAADMIEHRLGHRHWDADPLHAGGIGSANIVQDKVPDRIVVPCLQASTGKAKP